MRERTIDEEMLLDIFGSLPAKCRCHRNANIGLSCPILLRDAMRMTVQKKLKWEWVKKSYKLAVHSMGSRKRGKRFQLRLSAIEATKGLGEFPIRHQKKRDPKEGWKI